MQSLYARIFLFRLSSGIGASKLNCPPVHHPMDVDVTGGLGPIVAGSVRANTISRAGAQEQTSRYCTTPPHNETARNGALRRRRKHRMRQACQSF
jgi:hypothetical protein